MISGRSKTRNQRVQNCVLSATWYKLKYISANLKFQRVKKNYIGGKIDFFLFRGSSESPPPHRYTGPPLDMKVMPSLVGEVEGAGIMAMEGITNRDDHEYTLTQPNPIL